MDLLTEANLGLIHAAELYDPDSGYRFHTYASWWVFQYMSRFISENGIIRLPQHRADQLRRIRNAVSNTGTRDVNILSSETSIPETVIEMLIPYLSQVISLDAPVQKPSGAKGESLSEFVIEEKIDYDEGLMKDELWGMLQSLPERHRDVLMRRYGVFGHEQMTLQQVADELGITRERVRQIELRALQLCRQNSRSA